VEIRETVILMMGILLSMVYQRRTGWPCGGFLAPGILALSGQPAGALWLLAWSALTFLPLRALTLRFGLYGRQKVGVSLLIALSIRLLGLIMGGYGGFALGALHWSGFVVPGIVAAEAASVGLVPALCGTLSVGAVTLLLGGMLPWQVP